MLSWLTGGMGKLWAGLGALLAGLVAVLAIFRSGKSAGKNEVVVEAAKKEVENAKTANKIRRDVAAATPDDVDKRMRKYRRD